MIRSKSNPKKTWESQADTRLYSALNDSLSPVAQVHLYDHLTKNERSLEVGHPHGKNDQSYKKSVEEYSKAKATVAQYGVSEWATRFLRTLREQRQDRPVFLVCHSTGGIVVKHAISQASSERHHLVDGGHDPADEGHNLAAEGYNLAHECLGVTFFATPHHGSSVLSAPAYVQTVQETLGLKWEMSERLRRDFLLRNNNFLKTLNYKFAESIPGVKIKSYVETIDTSLTVFSTNDIGGESQTIIKLCIVDSRSGKLSTSDSPVEDEELILLNTTHVGVPKFMGERPLWDLYIREVTTFVKGFSADERARYQAFDDAIKTGVKVDVHQFYAAQNEEDSTPTEEQVELTSMKILSTTPSYRDFMDLGPDKCMEGRIRGQQTSPPIGDEPIPSLIDERTPEEPLRATKKLKRSKTYASVVKVGRAAKSVSRPATTTTNVSTLATVTSTQQDTRRGSTTSYQTDPGSSRHLASKPLATVTDTTPNDGPLQPDIIQAKDTDQLKRPPQVDLFPLPNASSDRFKWIHVPFTHAGWVPHILTRISRDRRNLNLHSQILLDNIWSSQHNSSRHASPHARFVKSNVKCLLPKNAPLSPTETIPTPPSATNDIQFVVYLPYLHWDSFENLQKRAEVIDRRRKLPYARPVPEDIANGKSLEHKLIWQYLTSDRPVHCRRTLDQYGYPSLRNTAVRDRDQILYKRTRGDQQVLQEPGSKPKLPPRRSPAGQATVQTPADNDEAAKVLMVDQLWLWILDKSTVVTFFASKEQEEKDRSLRGEGNLRNEIYRDINGDLANQCADPFDFAALAVYHAVKVLLDRTIDRNLQVFEIFEEYINILTEQQNASFKGFRNDHGFEHAKSDAESHLDNRKDLDALLELRDIDDELTMIEKLVKEQQECVKEMLKQYHHLHDHHGKKGANGIDFLRKTYQTLSENKERIASMLKSAHAAQKAFKDLLDMKQKQATIVEAHLAREQTILTRRQTGAAVEQARIVMIFTIVTIIFLPLSFFASVFGINAREWVAQPNAYPTIHTIFTYMGTISLAVIILALLVAFNRHTRRLLRKFWHDIGLPVFQRLRLARRPPPDQETSAEEGSSASVSALRLNKAAAVHTQKAKQLSALSRSVSHMNSDDKVWVKQQAIANGHLV